MQEDRKYDPWNTGPLVQLPQVQGMGGGGQQQPGIPGRAPMGPLGMIDSRLIDVGVTRGIDKGIAAGSAPAPVAADVMGADMATGAMAGVAAEGAAGGAMMTGLAAAAPWLAAGYLGGKALRLYNRGTGSVDFGNPADPFGFAKGGFVNPFMQKRQQPISPNQQPMSFHSDGGSGMATHSHAPLTAKGKGLPNLHARMLRPGGEE